MKKYLVGAIGATIGLLVVKGAYMKGFNEGIDRFKQQLDLAATITKEAKKQCEKES